MTAQVNYNYLITSAAERGLFANPATKLTTSILSRLAIGSAGALRGARARSCAARIQSRSERNVVMLLSRGVDALASQHREGACQPLARFARSDDFVNEAAFRRDEG